MTKSKTSYFFFTALRSIILSQYCICLRITYFLVFFYVFALRGKSPIQFCFSNFHLITFFLQLFKNSFVAILAAQDRGIETSEINDIEPILLPSVKTSNKNHFKLSLF